MSAYLGIDLGTSCGWAVITPNKRGFISAHGTWDNSIRVGHDSPSLRFSKFESQLEDVMSLGITRVFYELVYAHQGVKAGQMYGAFQAKLHEACDRYGVPFQGIPVQTVKKHITGTGHASKALMIEKLALRGFTTRTEDEADAIGVALTGWEKLT